eukprot:TRINITY_DN57781_c0_g1_i1.p1 TRINITY_DN57781_c0_g1~~TRINITY_DN57781_c0_g1_i1.p1  ORF type:complete len:250 (-),score=42.27 TRINITY_DN57781_c0_g1_i1:67-816(-)
MYPGRPKSNRPPPTGNQRHSRSSGDLARIDEEVDEFAQTAPPWLEGTLEPPRTGARGLSAPSTPAGPPPRAVTGRSASESRLVTGATGRSGRTGRSRCSVASLRSRIQEAVQNEVRTSLGDYFAMKEDQERRERKKALDRPPHLRPGMNPVDHCCLPNLISETHRGMQLPVKMAVDPKWSTELKKMNDRVGQCIEYQTRLSSSVSGQIAPELPFMHKKSYLSNPPTPYFVPGRRPVHPADRKGVSEAPA